MTWGLSPGTEGRLSMRAMGSLSSPSSSVRAVVIAVAVAACTWSARGAAQTDDPRVQEARRVFDQAEAHYGAAEYLLAARDYERAYELMREAGRDTASIILFNVALSLDAVPGREREARDRYVAFVAQTTANTPLIVTQLQRARARIQELDARLALNAAEGSISPVGPIVMGVGGLLGAVAIGTGVAALGEESSLASECDGDVCPDTPALRNRREGMLSLSITTDLLLGVGAAAVLTGLILTLLLRDEPASASTSVAFACDPAACAAIARGTF